MALQVMQKSKKLVRSDFGLKWQLLFFIFVLLTSGMGASAYFRIFEGYETRKSFLDDRGELVLDTLADTIAAPLWYLNYQSVDNALDGVAFLSGFHRVHLTTADQQTFERVHDHSDHEFGSAPRQNLRKKIYWLEKRFEKEDREVFLGELNIEIEYNDAAAYLDNAIKSTIYFYIPLLIVLMGMVWFVLSKLSDPIERLAGIMYLIGKDEVVDNIQGLSIPYQKEQNELGKLSRSLETIRLHSLELRELRNNLEEQVKSQTKELMLARDIAEAGSEAKTNFLANISHELRTPLNAVIGMGQLLKGGELEETQEEYVDLILSSGDSLLILINDLLDLAQLEKDELKLINAPYQLMNITAGLRTNFSDRLQHAQTQLRVRNDFSAETWYTGDAQRIKQILFSLLSNAVKFTEGGKITLSVSVTGSDADELVLSVEDSGIGISFEDQAKLFDNFMQVEGNLSRKFQGLGAGLSLVSALVQLMDGQISVKSKLGVGSTFTVKLPLRKSDEIGNEIAEHPEDDITLDEIGRPLKVLVVEDNPINQMLIIRILEEAGHTVIAADDGNKAVKAVKKEPFDIILMDIQMPEMDGLTAYRFIRILENERGNIPIVAVTANTLQKDRDRYAREGFNGFIGKPISAKSLLGVMTDLCSRKSVPGLDKNFKEAHEKPKWVDNEKKDTGLERRKKEIDDALTLPLMDDRQWNEMSDAIGNEVLIDLMSSLPADLDKYCVSLKDLSNKNDMDEFKREVHTLKGLASNSALSRLARFAGMMNQVAAQDENPVDYIEYLDAITIDSKRVLSEKLGS